MLFDWWSKLSLQLSSRKYSLAVATIDFARSSMVLPNIEAYGVAVVNANTGRERHDCNSLKCCILKCNPFPVITTLFATIAVSQISREFTILFRWRAEGDQEMRTQRRHNLAQRKEDDHPRTLRPAGKKGDLQDPLEPQMLA